MSLLALTGWLLLAFFIAWIWHGHGIRERALVYVQQRCQQQKVLLLDGNVAFRGWGIRKDSKGYKRIARLYQFEFTVTGNERLLGQAELFGKRLNKISFAPHPLMDEMPQGVEIEGKKVEKSAQVVQISAYFKDN